MQNKQRIIEKFITNIWLFENVFWKVTDLIVYDTEYEKAKRILSQVYWYKDVYDLFPAELDERKVNETLKTLFTYYDKWEMSGTVQSK